MAAWKALASMAPAAAQPMAARAEASFLAGGSVVARRTQPLCSLFCFFAVCWVGCICFSVVFVFEVQKATKGRNWFLQIEDVRILKFLSCTLHQKKRISLAFRTQNQYVKSIRAGLDDH